MTLWQRRPTPLQMLVGALAIHVIAFAIAAVNSPKPAGDFDRYYEIGSTAGRPYVDYQVEHPIATLLVFKSLARLPHGRAGFGLGVVVLDLIGDALIVAALFWGWGLVAAAYFAVALIPVHDLFFNRIDAWSTAAAILAVAGWRRRHPGLLGTALALGGAFKLWPLVLAPLIVAPWRGRGSWTALASFAVTATAVAGAALWIAGAGGVMQVLTFRGATGWQVESLVGNLKHLADARTLRMESGSFRIGQTSGLVSIAMFLAAAPICLWSTWRGARVNLVGAGWLAGICVLLLLSALLSAQYVIWLLPAAAIAWTEGDRRLAILTAVAVLLTGIMWTSYGAVINSQRWALLNIAIRNAVLVTLAISAIVRIAKARASA